VKYRLTAFGKEHAVELDPRAEGVVTVTLDGRTMEAHVHSVPGGFLLRLGARVYDLVAYGNDANVSVSSRAARAEVTVESERGRDAGRASRSAKELRAPMPGRIVKVLVKAGDTIEAGSSLIVMEAMKMENELRAPGAGSVAEVRVREGQTVEGNAVLVTFA
jgi:biotin carboxyl carrier protein